MDIYPCAKFYCNSFTGSLPPNMWNITLLWLFLLYCPFLSWLYYFFLAGRTPGRILTIYGLNDASSPKDVPFGGLDDEPQY